MLEIVRHFWEWIRSTLDRIRKPSMSNDLTFVHTLVHQVLGVKADESGRTLLFGEEGEALHITLVTDAEEFCADADVSAAIGTMLLRGLIGGGPSGDFEERLQVELSETRRKRIEGRKEQDFLVIRRRGKVPDWQASAERDFGNFVVRLNGEPTLGIQEATTTALAASLVSVSAATERPVRLTAYAQSTVFFTADGKKIFAKELKGGAASAFVSGPLQTGSAKKVRESLENMLQLSDLTRVFKLYAESLEKPYDRLRSFLSAWTALEIFVGKVFPDYEDAFLGALAPDDAPQAQAWYVKRIRDVMQSRYRSRDRFALIAASLDPAGADADSEVFKKAKAIRDALAHGRDTDEASMPVEAVQQLLSKYLQLHGSAST